MNLDYDNLKSLCLTFKLGGMPLESAREALTSMIRGNGTTLEFIPTALGELELVYNRKQEKPPVSELVRDYAMKTFGVFSTQDVYHGLALMSGADKQQCRRELKELADRNVLARLPGKDGFYRRVDQSIKYLDWQNANLDNTLDVIFPPFGFEKYVKIYPGSIIGLAGSTNSGKTGLLLNFIKGNMHSYPIIYYTNELGAEELKNRLQGFAGLGIAWKFTTVQRSKDYADIVRLFPDNIHVIDYLATYDKFSLVGEEIDNIFQALRRGLAFIAFQKTADTKDNERLMGRGGDFTAERSRLYLSMDKNKLTIVKAKNWRTDVNPDGKKFTFKLVNGCLFQDIREVN